MKILILALSGIGDALMFTPALKLLREALPYAEIDALVMFKGVRDIYDRNIHLNKVIYFDFMKEGIMESFRFIRTIRNKYDASVNVYPSNRSSTAEMPKGFSTNRCLPAFAAAITSRWCRLVCEQTTAPWTSGSAQ